MPHIGKYLASARKQLDEIRLENEKEYNRRHSKLYALLPELKQIDTTLSRQMAEICKISMGGAENADIELKKLRDLNLDLQMKRAETLKAQGYPIDYLDYIYSCERCHDSGTLDGNICPCLEELYRKEFLEGLLSELPERNCSFEGFDLSLYDGEETKKAMKVILSGCRKFADNFPNVSNGFLFQGGSGLGKTFLASCIARSLAEKGFNVCYESACSLFGVFETERFSRSQEESEAAAKRINEFFECDLLILDDLGAELSSSTTVSAFYSLFSGRIGKGRKTIICTCCPDDELKRRYGEQLYSRLKGDLVAFHFAGNDIRIKRRGF